MKIDFIVYLGLLLASTFSGFAVSSEYGEQFAYPGAALGFIIGFGLIYFSISLKKKNINRLCWGAIGFVGGLLAGALVNTSIEPFLGIAPLASFALKGLSLLFFSYVGTLVSLRFEADSEIASKKSQESSSSEFSSKSLKILDTSVIIDGRIADLCETGFLEGIFVTPQFILLELQHIADSSDSMKRARGRRGLDVLHRLQQMPDIKIQIVETDFPKIREVDSKIVALGKSINAKIITNDLNLNKVAELQGVRVLNINQLCNALKPVVLPGEVMRVFVLKEGKEMGQGIAYLDDGTMIVIDDARKSIGKTVQITVTSVLQTPAGRMIFSRFRPGSNGETNGGPISSSIVPTHEVHPHSQSHMAENR